MAACIRKDDGAHDANSFFQPSSPTRLNVTDYRRARRKKEERITAGG